MNTISQKLQALRQAMKENGFDAWIIPSADPHLSEYLPEHWQARVAFSGFTGSVGTLVVTAHAATLWVDSRYWEQASKQLNGSSIELGKLGLGKTHIDWLLEQLADNTTVGVAPDMLSIAAKRQLETALVHKNISLNHQQDIVTTIWTERPSLPHETIYPHHATFVDVTAQDKLAKVREFMREKGADWHLISSLDDIAWLTNLRGNDVSYNPVFLSYLLINHDNATLFVDNAKLSNTERALLNHAGIEIAEYTDIVNAIADVSGSLLFDPNKTAVATLQKLSPNVKWIEHINPSTFFKSQKTTKEIAHIREAMVQDGIALCGFFAELEQKLANGESVNELDISDMLIAHRSQREHYVSPSFNTIAGFNANGALPHYSATAESYSEIKGQGLLLIDSGGQYHTGTTDITRVIAIGMPTPEQKHDFTLVLKAHIALAQAIFPENLPAPMLDAICRAPMWQAQCDYGHGTGHGVGYFLNVHEGPQVISYHANPQPHHAMKAGMFTSNEPGLYRPNKWGIRIESLVINQKVEQVQETEFGNYLYFETVTLCPIDTRLVEKSLLNDNEIAWLNAYHEKVRLALQDHVNGIAHTWLIQATKAI
jgi:peptidase, M24 family